MLKNKIWIVALIAALTIAFIGCSNMGYDPDYVAPAEDLEIDGADLEITAIGTGASAVSIKGSKITFTGAGTSVGFSFPIPEEASDYTKLVVHFKVLTMTDEGKPGIMIKKNNRLENLPGITDQNPAYQYNHAATSGEGGFPIKPGLNFEEGMEFATDEWDISDFDGVVAFQHQAWNPTGNSPASYALQLVKLVFPGVKEATVTFDTDGGKAVADIVVQQGKEIGDLPVTTKDGAIFAGWYIGTEEIISDYIVPVGATVALKAKWVTTGITVTKTSVIAAYPKFTSSTGATATVDASGKAVFGAPTGWVSVKYEYPEEVTYENSVAPYSYNVVELTLTSDKDFVIQTQNGAASGNIQRYPTGSEVVTLKAGENTTFSLALSDTGAAGLAIQNKQNEAGNADGATVTIVSAVFTKGTMHDVTFGAGAPIDWSGNRAIKVVDGRKVPKPSDPSDLTLSNEAFEFQYWMLDGKKYDFDAAVTKDIDLIAKFDKVIVRVVSFDLDESTVNGKDRVPSQTLAVGKTFGDINWDAVLPDAPFPTGAIGYRWFDGDTYYYNATITGSTASGSVVDGSSISKDVTFKLVYTYPFVIEGVGEIPVADIISTTSNADFTIDGVYGGISIASHNWEWRIVKIPITLPTGKTLGDLKSVTLDLTGVAGDPTSNKSYYLLAGNPLTQNTSWQWANMDHSLTAAAVNANVANGTAVPLTFTIDPAKITSNPNLTTASTTFEISIWANMGSSVKYTLTNIKFNFE